MQVNLLYDYVATVNRLTMYLIVFLFNSEQKASQVDKL